MPFDSLDRLLSQLEEAKRHFDSAGAGRVESLLLQLNRRDFQEAHSLIRFHEALLFVRSHPANARVLRLADDALSSFADRVGALRRVGADLTPLDYIEYSGIAATTIIGTFSYAIARWLAGRYPDQVDIDWERYGKKDRLGLTLPRILPLLYEESLVEANIPYKSWLKGARGRHRDLAFILERFERLKTDDGGRAELYDLMELPIKWELGSMGASRTNNRSLPSRVFYHRGPLIKRSELSLEREMSREPFKLERLSRKEGGPVLDRVKETTTVRYRELYGITNGDPGQVVRAEAGRGVEMYLWGLAPERRLPLRAYHAGFTLKNGVPVNYIEAISLFERAEVGFNTFYTYREGESAWVYAQVLRLLRQAVGITCFSIDPYQIGFNNEEAIESGAFWFYRKLGFRPIRPELVKIARREEARVASDRSYRTPARVLRRLSRGRIVYEAPGSQTGYWDGFEVRNLGFAVQRRTAEQFDGDPDAMRAAAVDSVAGALGLPEPGELKPRAFEGLALVLSLVPDLPDWSREEKRRASEIILAKAGRSETRYARLLQRHSRMREALRAMAAGVTADA